MALVICPECRNEVSDKALACPRCGLPAPGQATARTESRTAPHANIGEPLNSTVQDAPRAKTFEKAKTWAYWAGGFGVVVGIGAGAKGGGIVLGLIAGVMIAAPLAAIGFLLGWAVSRVQSDSPTSSKSAKPSPETHVLCPDCRKLIAKESRACNFCGCKLVPQ